MFWNPFKKTKAPYEEPKVPTGLYELIPNKDITAFELMWILQHYVPGQGTALPNGPTEIPVGYLPPQVMRHLKEVPR